MVSPQNLDKPYRHSAFAEGLISDVSANKPSMLGYTAVEEKLISFFGFNIIATSAILSVIFILSYKIDKL